ncbi:mercury resistance system transport protein MerF [Pseudooceanicola nanhaiensis]|uniref:mercury resistance system transport protein MerF n=1 Tax=Pseudooceanicola nanhaiensis TaxID=375761 RepID=UPI0040591729
MIPGRRSRRIGSSPDRSRSSGRDPSASVRSRERDCRPPYYSLILVLLPALVVFIGIILYALWRRQRTE